MNTKLASWRAWVVCALVGWAGMAAAPAAAGSDPVVGIVDMKRPKAGRLHLPASAPRTTQLHFLRLSEPAAGAIECCLRVRAGAPNTGVSLTVEGREVTLRSARVRLSRPVEEGFIGLALGGVNPRARRVSAHEVELAWPGTQQRVKVFHCLTGEALQVWAVDAASEREVGRYSVPLGMDVEADCSESIMPAR